MHPVPSLKDPQFSLKGRKSSALSPEWQKVVQLSAAVFLRALGKRSEAEQLEQQYREEK